MQKEKMYLPDYKGGSIVNLMSSIGNALGAKMPYPELRTLHSNEIKNSTNIVLIIVDGLGYEYLKEKKDSFLYQNTRNPISAVFLPTTASGITTFNTGVAPQQHAITGWHMNLKEIGMVTTILPFIPRAKGSINQEKIKISEILKEKGFTERIKSRAYKLFPKEIEDSAYTMALSKKSKIIGFNNLQDMSREIGKLAKSKKRKFIYAYWPEFDGLAHEFGIESLKAGKHFKKLDKIIDKLAKNLKGSNTIMIVTADHGLISLPANERIFLSSHPKLKECLTLPMCGEPRLKYCYVHPSKAKEFEEYIKRNLSKYCWLFKSEDLIKRNFFGFGKPSPDLFDRVGDYILVMKKNYVIKDDSVLGESDHKHIGNHGGVSKQEMFVPLIVIKA